MRQQVLQVGDLRLHLLVFLFDLLAFQGGQPAQLHIQDGLRLQLAQLEALHQVRLGDIGVLRLADGLDDRIEVVQRDQIVRRGCAGGHAPWPVRSSSGGR